MPLTSLKPDDLQGGSGRRVADDHLREALRVATDGTDGKAFLQALNDVSANHPQYSGVRRVRMLEPLSVIPVRDAQGRAYKAYKGDANSRFDVWELSDGRWTTEIVSMFDAHQPEWRSSIRAQNHNARRVLSLKGDDLIARDTAEGRKLLRVVKFSNGQVVLAPPDEAGDLKRRHEIPADVDPFRYVFLSGASLKTSGARQVRIDELGRILDPGPRSPPPVRAAG